MTKYDVFDFDKTLYIHDSTVMFYLYCLKKYPRLFKYLPKESIEFIKFKLKIIPKKAFKEGFFKFVDLIDDIDKEVDEFWKINKSKIRTELIQKNGNKKVVISASPEFILKGICKEIGIDTLIATNIDKNTGKFTGNNCYGEEKVVRFYEKFGNIEPEAFYSDSLSDQPMADISKKSYLIKKNEVLDWPKN